jgi:hypothetical protein
VLLRVTDCGALGVPTFRVLKLRLVGETVAEVDVAGGVLLLPQEVWTAKTIKSDKYDRYDRYDTYDGTPARRTKPGFQGRSDPSWLPYQSCAPNPR